MDKPQAPDQPLLQPSPVRVLVQTLTHLVPSDRVIYKPERNIGGDKLWSMYHRICQHQWGCEFQPDVHRWYSYGDDQFGYNNRPCFFLIDYGTAEDGENVPILPYEWTGEEFKSFPDLLQSKDVQEELKATPFTPPPPKVGPDRPTPIRKIVRSRLRGEERIMDRHIEHLKEHPEDMEWLKRKLRPRFYENLLAQIEARPREKEEDERESDGYGW